MVEDLEKLAYRIHCGITSSSESDSGKDDFDVEYYKFKPPPLDYESIKDYIVEIPADMSSEGPIKKMAINNENASMEKGEWMEVKTRRKSNSKSTVEEKCLNMHNKKVNGGAIKKQKKLPKTPLHPLENKNYAVGKKKQSSLSSSGGAASKQPNSSSRGSEEKAIFRRLLQLDIPELNQMHRDLDELNKPDSGFSKKLIKNEAKRLLNKEKNIYEKWFAFSQYVPVMEHLKKRQREMYENWLKQNKSSQDFENLDKNKVQLSSKRPRRKIVEKKPLEGKANTNVVVFKTKPKKTPLNALENRIYAVGRRKQSASSSDGAISNQPNSSSRSSANVIIRDIVQPGIGDLEKLNKPDSGFSKEMIKNETKIPNKQKEVYEKLYIKQKEQKMYEDWFEYNKSLLDNKKLDKNKGQRSSVEPIKENVTKKKTMSIEKHSSEGKERTKVVLSDKAPGGIPGDGSNEFKQNMLNDNHNIRTHYPVNSYYEGIYKEQVNDMEVEHSQMDGYGFVGHNSQRLTFLDESVKDVSGGKPCLTPSQDKTDAQYKETTDVHLLSNSNVTDARCFYYDYTGQNFQAYLDFREVYLCMSLDSIPERQQNTGAKSRDGITDGLSQIVGKKKQRSSDGAVSKQSSSSSCGSDKKAILRQQLQLDMTELNQTRRDLEKLNEPNSGFSKKTIKNEAKHLLNKEKNIYEKWFTFAQYVPVTEHLKKREREMYEGWLKQNKSLQDNEKLDKNNGRRSSIEPIKENISKRKTKSVKRKPVEGKKKTKVVVSDNEKSSVPGSILGDGFEGFIQNTLSDKYNIYNNSYYDGIYKEHVNDKEVEHSQMDGYLDTSLDESVKDVSGGKPCVAQREDKTDARYKETTDVHLLSNGNVTDARCFYYDYTGQNFQAYLDFREVYLCMSLDSIPERQQNTGGIADGVTLPTVSQCGGRGNRAPPKKQSTKRKSREKTILGVNRRKAVIGLSKIIVSKCDVKENKVPRRKRNTNKNFSMITNCDSKNGDAPEGKPSTKRKGKKKIVAAKSVPVPRCDNKANIPNKKLNTKAADVIFAAATKCDTSEDSLKILYDYNISQRKYSDVNINYKLFLKVIHVAFILLSAYFTKLVIFKYYVHIYLFFIYSFVLISCLFLLYLKGK